MDCHAIYNAQRKEVDSLFWWKINTESFDPVNVSKCIPSCVKQLLLEWDAEGDSGVPMLHAQRRSTSRLSQSEFEQKSIVVFGNRFRFNSLKEHIRNELGLKIEKKEIIKIARKICREARFVEKGKCLIESLRQRSLPINPNHLPFLLDTNKIHLVTWTNVVYIGEYKLYLVLTATERNDWLVAVHLPQTPIIDNHITEIWPIRK